MASTLPFKLIVEKRQVYVIRDLKGFCFISRKHGYIRELGYLWSDGSFIETASSPRVI